MKNFSKIVAGVAVQELLQQLQAQPNIWNRNPCRLSCAGPHHQSDDIIVRYKDETACLKDYSQWLLHVDEHIPVWYEAVEALPACKPLVQALMSDLKAEMLGGVVIYRVRPGKKIYPHIDKGWHPEYYDKFNICLQSNPEAGFMYDDCVLMQEAGDIHWFRNDVQHSVINEGTTDHIIMTVCLRFDRGYRCPFAPADWALEKQAQQQKG